MYRIAPSHPVADFYTHRLQRRPRLPARSDPLRLDYKSVVWPFDVDAVPGMKWLGKLYTCHLGSGKYSVTVPI